MTSTYSDRIKGIATSVAVKAPCRAATTANITLSGLQTIDAVVLAAGDRVLVKNQTDTTQNGIWNASASAWSRAADFDDDRDVVKATEVIVTDGTAAASKRYRIASANPVVIGTSAITWSLVPDINAGVIGVDIQGWNAGLQSIAGLAEAANKGLYTTGDNVYALFDLTAAARTVLDDASTSAMLATLGGQPLDADLTAIAALTRVRGDVISGGASAWQRLALGTVGKGLFSDGTDVVYAPPGKIATETGLTGLSQKDIALPTGFSAYRLVIWDLLFGTAGGTLGLRVSTDAGVSFISTGSYTTAGNSLNPGTANSIAMGNSATATSVQLTQALGATAGKEVSGEILMFPGTVFVCKSSLAHEDNGATTGSQAFARGRHASASVNSIRLLPSAGTFGLSYSLIGVA